VVSDLGAENYWTKSFKEIFLAYTLLNTPLILRHGRASTGYASNCAKDTRGMSRAIKRNGDVFGATTRREIAVLSARDERSGITRFCFPRTSESSRRVGRKKRKHGAQSQGRLRRRRRRAWSVNRRECVRGISRHY